MVKTPRANCLSRAQAGASWAVGRDKADTRHFSFSRRGYARTLTERSIRASGFFLPLGPPSSLGCFGRRRRGFQLGVFELGHGRVAAAVATRDPRPTPSRSHTLTSLPYLHGVPGISKSYSWVGPAMLCCVRVQAHWWGEKLLFETQRRGPVRGSDTTALVWFSLSTLRRSHGVWASSWDGMEESDDS